MDYKELSNEELIDECRRSSNGDWISGLKSELRRRLESPGGELPSIEHIQLAVASGWLNMHSGATLTSSWDMAVFLADLAANGLITINV